MWSPLLYVICVGLLSRGQAASSGQVVIRRVKDLVSLECPAVSDADEYKGVMWNKNTVAFLTSDRKQNVDYVSGTASSRISVNSQHQLTLTDLEMSDSGNYSCQIYVNKSGTLEPRETAYILIIQDVPGAPGKPTVTDIESRQAEITWAPSSANNSPVTAYVLNIRDCQTDTSTLDLVVSNESSSVTVDGLSPSQCYTARVSAVNAVGRGSLSAPSDPFYTTEEDLGDVNSTAVVMDSTQPTNATFLRASETTVQHQGLTQWLNVFWTRSQTALVVSLLMLANLRFRRCHICQASAYLSLAVPVCGHDPNAETVKRCVVWMFVILVLILLFHCYSFQLWKSCYSKVKKYVIGWRCQELVSAVCVEELAVIPVETDTLPPRSSLTGTGHIYPQLELTDFLNKVQAMKMNDDRGFCEEFQDITNTTEKYNFSAEHFDLERNKSKNRYLNIPTYDHSRVVLATGDPCLDQSDYIHANYVQGYKNPQAYIATQGPLPNTVCDFWRMVWQENSNIIVMITNFEEKGRTKCEQYWPTKGEEEYGSLVVRLMSTDHQAYYITRVFALSEIQIQARSSTDVRTVHHYHYTQWPDHGVPCHLLPVLSFVLKSAAQRTPQCGPVVVHCSAGMGRTGTYILIDVMIAQILDTRSVNIPGFLLDIRKQRYCLVQTEEQYKCVHEVLVEYLQASGTTEVSEDQLSHYLPLLDQPFKNRFLSHDPQDTPTLLERQFQLITEYTATESQLSPALDACNKYKNKPGGLLPVSSSRVVLSAVSGLAESDYINASFLQGYTKLEEFVVTQHPTELTVPDFWRMVWQVKSPVIVVLSYPGEKEEVEFWPAKCAGKNLDVAGLCVTRKTPSVFNRSKNLTTLEVVIDFNEDLVKFLTRVMIVKDWPHGYRKLHRVFGPISAANSYITSEDCGPVIVVDRYGGVEAGTFCALWTLKDQLLSERCADLYQVCKLYHNKRPGIFMSQENYLFIHRALAAFHKHTQARRDKNSYGNLYENTSCDCLYNNISYKQL